MKFVTIKHPKLKGEGSCSKEAYEKVWKKKGWTITGEAEGPKEDQKEAPKQPTK